MKSRSMHRQQGVAIIMAVLISALVAAMAFLLAGRQRLWLFQLENQQDRIAAAHVSIGAINLARLTIRDDGRNNRYDHLAEPWNTPIPAIKVEEGKVAGVLLEAQGRFNINNLIKNQQIDSQQQAALGRLLERQGLSAGLADDIGQFLTQRLQSAPSANIDLRSLPVDLAELAGLPSINPERMRQLTPWLVALPEPTPLNVNFVAPELLVALIPDLALSEAQRILAVRTTQPFESVAQFMEKVPSARRRDFERWAWTVQSDYFYIYTEAWYGRAYLRYQALLKRNGDDNAQVVWLKRIYDGQ